jgi:hypothetical protein
MRELLPGLDQTAWLIGTAVGVCFVLAAAALGWLTRRGKAPRLTRPLYWCAVVWAFSYLWVAVFMLLGQEPGGIWYGLGLGGLIGIAALGLGVPQCGRSALADEERRMGAQDL